MSSHEKSAAANSAVGAAVAQHNAGREPERLALKMGKMKQSPFIFLRGAADLFYAALPDEAVLTRAPLAWCCGDMHFENFGSYKADNRLVYFDVNDFDEAALAPCTWDVLRLLTSILCGAEDLQATPAQALAVSRDCLAAYAAALIQGKPLWVERDTAVGLIKDLLDELRERDRADFLDKRTVKKGKSRSLKTDGVKALAASEAQKQQVKDFIEHFASTQADPGFFEVLDVARRIAGTGSLGVDRYVILVAGKGSPDGNFLLDLKQAQPSALMPRLQTLGVAQPQWRHEAERVVTVQKRMQAVDHAFLFAVEFDGQPFLLKALQPTEDRVAIGEWGHKLDNLRQVVQTMGRLIAWDQLRASGRSGAASADALVDFARSSGWQEPLLHLAEVMTAATKLQWQEFVAAGS